jgi:hypothetical protein
MELEKVAAELEGPHLAEVEQMVRQILFKSIDS